MLCQTSRFFLKGHHWFVYCKLVTMTYPSFPPVLHRITTGYLKISTPEGKKPTMEFLISFPGPLRAGSWEVWGSFQAAVPRRPPKRIWSRRPWSASIWSYRWRRFAHCLAWWRFSGQVPRLETWELRQVMIIMKLLCLEYWKYVRNISPRKRKYPDMRPQAVLRRTYTDKSFSPGPHSRISIMISKGRHRRTL